MSAELGALLVLGGLLWGEECSYWGQVHAAKVAWSRVAVDESGRRAVILGQAYHVTVEAGGNG